MKKNDFSGIVDDSEFDDCLDQSVTLESKNGVEFKKRIKDILFSNTIKNLIKDAGTDDVIPVDVNSKTLTAILEFYTKFRRDKMEPLPQRGPVPKDFEQTYFKEFGEANFKNYLDIMNACNYLDAPVLLRAMTVYIAWSIENCCDKEDSEECVDAIRNKFGLKNDHKDYEKIKKETATIREEEESDVSSSHVDEDDDENE